MAYASTPPTLGFGFRAALVILSHEVEARKLQPEPYALDLEVQALYLETRNHSPYFLFFKPNDTTRGAGICNPPRIRNVVALNLQSPTLSLELYNIRQRTLYSTS